jgi:hypothetical protein
MRNDVARLGGVTEQVAPAQLMSVATNAEATTAIALRFLSVFTAAP